MARNYSPYDTPYGVIGALRNTQDIIRNAADEYLKNKRVTGEQALGMAQIEMNAGKANAENKIRMAEAENAGAVSLGNLTQDQFKAKQSAKEFEETKAANAYQFGENLKLNQAESVAKIAEHNAAIKNYEEQARLSEKLPVIQMMKESLDIRYPNDPDKVDYELEKIKQNFSPLVLGSRMSRGEFTGIVQSLSNSNDIVQRNNDSYKSTEAKYKDIIKQPVFTPVTKKTPDGKLSYAEVDVIGNAVSANALGQLEFYKKQIDNDRVNNPTGSAYLTFEKVYLGEDGKTLYSADDLTREQADTFIATKKYPVAPNMMLRAKIGNDPTTGARKESTIEDALGFTAFKLQKQYPIPATAAQNDPIKEMNPISGKEEIKLFPIGGANYSFVTSNGRYIPVRMDKILPQPTGAGDDAAKKAKAAADSLKTQGVAAGDTTKTQGINKQTIPTDITLDSLAVSNPTLPIGLPRLGGGPDTIVTPIVKNIIQNYSQGQQNTISRLEFEKRLEGYNPATYRGQITTNKDTGQRYMSNGIKWIKLDN